MKIDNIVSLIGEYLNNLPGKTWEGTADELVSALGDPALTFQAVGRAKKALGERGIEIITPVKRGEKRIFTLKGPLPAGHPFAFISDLDLGLPFGAASSLVSPLDPGGPDHPALQFLSELFDQKIPADLSVLPIRNLYFLNQLFLVLFLSGNLPDEFHELAEPEDEDEYRKIVVDYFQSHRLAFEEHCEVLLNPRVIFLHYQQSAKLDWEKLIAKLRQYFPVSKIIWLYRLGEAPPIPLDDRFHFTGDIRDSKHVRSLKKTRIEFLKTMLQSLDILRSCTVNPASKFVFVVGPMATGKRTALNILSDRTLYNMKVRGNVSDQEIGIEIIESMKRLLDINKLLAQSDSELSGLDPAISIAIEANMNYIRDIADPTPGRLKRETSRFSLNCFFQILPWLKAASNSFVLFINAELRVLLERVDFDLHPFRSFRNNQMSEAALLFIEASTYVDLLRRFLDDEDFVYFMTGEAKDRASRYELRKMRKSKFSPHKRIWFVDTSDVLLSESPEKIEKWWRFFIDHDPPFEKFTEDEKFKEAFKIVRKEFPTHGFNRMLAPVHSLCDLFEVDLGAQRKICLLLGPTGSGKEIAGNLIHRLSKSKEEIYVKENAGFPKEQPEYYWYGYGEGAFQDKGGRIGPFEEASGGTLFLDEVGELDPASQVIFLRVLQDWKFKKFLGKGKNKQKDQEIDINSAIVLATNRVDLEKDSNFRKDLYYRIEGQQIVLPALRDRKEDLFLLTVNFGRRKFGKVRPEFTLAFYTALFLFDWPGNVRQLEKVIEQITARTGNVRVGLRSLKKSIRNSMGLESESERQIVDYFSMEESDVFISM